MARKKYRSFNCFPDDFLAGTAGMEPILFKAHTRLFMLMYSMGGPLKYDLRVLARQIEVPRAFDAKRLIDKLIETKSYAIHNGHLHLKRVDEELGITGPVWPVQTGDDGPSREATKGLSDEPNAEKNAIKSTKRGTKSRARARASSSSNNSKSSLSFLDDLPIKTMNGSASAMLGSPGLMDRSPSPPSERESTGPPNYSTDPVQPSAALLRSLERMKPKSRR